MIYLRTSLCPTARHWLTVEFDQRNNDKGWLMLPLGTLSLRCRSGAAISLLFLSALSVASGFAQEGTTAPSSIPAKPAPPPPGEEGFPVKDQGVISKCGACHAPDTKGNMSRISWIR